MSTTDKILFFAGYTSEFGNNQNRTPLDIEIGRNNTYVARSRSQKKVACGKKFLTVTYELMIFLIMLWTVPYCLYMAIRDENINPFGRSWFQIVIALQYYHAITYFGKNHFYENIGCNTKLRHYISVILPIATVLSIALAAMNVALLNTGFRFHAYDEIYDIANTTGKVFLSILIFFDSLYSYLTFTVNACVFSINMLYHKQTVANYSESLNTYIRQSMNVIRKVNNVAVEFAQMKTKFDETVSLLTPFFSSLNFVGFITMYFYMEAFGRNDLSIIEYTNLILFILTEIVYLVSIQAVNANISNISDTINSNTLVATFFGNKNFNRVMPISGSGRTDTQDANIADLDGVGDTVTSDVHGLRVDRVDGQRDTNGNHVAVKLENNSLSEGAEDDSDESYRVVKKNTSLLMNDSAEYHRSSTRRTAQFPNSDAPSVEMDELRELYGGITEGVTNNTGMLRHIMVASISNQQMIDWITLRSIVEGRWKTFRIFGVEFTDTTLISKLFGVGVAVLMSAQLGFILKWW